jgi:hypothetical protein
MKIINNKLNKIVIYQFKIFTCPILKNSDFLSASLRLLLVMLPNINASVITSPMADEALATLFYLYFLIYLVIILTLF